MKQHFIISSQYEYSFWEMAYTLEKVASGYRRKRRNWIKNRSNVIDRYGSYLSIYFFLSNLRKVISATEMAK